MANPAALTITELTKNGQTARPAGDTVDTAGMVPINADGKVDRLIVEVTNNNVNALTVTIGAGDNPPSIQAKSLVSSAIAQNAVAVFGPFERGRFLQSGSDAGEIHVSFAGTAVGCTVRCYRLPKA
jgi:hypothetical protein